MTMQPGLPMPAPKKSVLPMLAIACFVIGAVLVGFFVWRIVVTDKKWNVSPGLRIGMSRAQVERVLGKAESVEQEGGTEILHFGPFEGNDASVWITLRDGFAVEIGAAEDWT